MTEPGQRPPDQAKKVTSLIDIIIVNYKSTDFLFRCIRSIRDAANGLSVRILVHDNHSNEDLDGLIRAFPEVELTMSDANIGFARAINRALAGSTAPYILILNPDTYILEGFFKSSMFVLYPASPSFSNRDIIDRFSKVIHDFS